MWEPIRRARALSVSHQPCPLDEIVMAAQYLGLSPTQDAKLMFLVDAMLCPELPVGWLRKSTPSGEYFWNSLCGLAQWEHPQISFLTGVADHLKLLNARTNGVCDGRKAR